MSTAFKGGINPLKWIHHGKHLSSGSSIVAVPAPDMLTIPMARVTGAVLDPLVKKGDKVKMGQCIGEAKSFISAPIHSPVSGEVVAVEQRPHPAGSRAMSVVIKNDRLDTKDESVKPLDFTKMSSEEIIDAIRDKGIVGMGGATFPTHVKLRVQGKKIDYLIGNGAECEPYLTADHRLMLEYAEQVIGGMKIVMKALGLDYAVIGIEDNKKDAIAKLTEAAKDTNIRIKSLKVKYPQGGEKQLIKAITRREVPTGKLPADVGCVVVNVGTLSAIYKAFTTGMPLVERVVTVTGSGVNSPANLLVRIGTSFNDCIKAAGGLNENAEKIISGGPMMGVAEYAADVPVIAGTSGILCLAGNEAHVPEQTACIRCGRCVDHCPMNLMPYLLSDAVELNDLDKIKEYDIMDCIECGSCVYVCPAKRYLLQNIRLGKTLLRQAAAKEVKK